MLQHWENSAERHDIIGDIITLRASFLIDRALRGLRIDFDEALKILRNHNDFASERERQQRGILCAALDNLIEFAAAEEISMIETLPAEITEGSTAEYEEICERYNRTYAEAENRQVLGAATMAAWWLTVGSEAWVTFMTQGDERVRPLHLSFEGLLFRKSEFPPELIPPIEWGCRCFLVSEGMASVKAAMPRVDFKAMVHPVFRESLATGGRIFSQAHAYFQTPLPKYAGRIVKRLKSKFYVQNNA